jgi:hypothetical protein
VNRNQQEMSLWRRVFERWYSRKGYEIDTCGGIADAAVEQFRLRYPVEPAAPEAVWYDEPPFARDGKSYPCWIVELWRPVLVAYFSDGSGWNWSYTGLSKRDFWHPLQGRRVSPIHKPQGPTT